MNLGWLKWLIEAFLYSRVINILSGIFFVYWGLGWFGLVGGWSGKRGIVAYIYGVFFILWGIGALFRADPRTKREKSFDPEKLTDVKDLAQKGDTIAAMRLYREITGASVKDAKSAVERLAQNDQP